MNDLNVGEGSTLFTRRCAAWGTTTSREAGRARRPNLQQIRDQNTKLWILRKRCSLQQEKDQRDKELHRRIDRRVESVETVPAREFARPSPRRWMQHPS